MDPDRTGVVTFEVSKLDNFWWKVEIFELCQNVKHDLFFFFNWLANWPQNDKGPGNLTLVTSELRGVWGRFYFQELVSNLFSLWILSDSINYSVFILFQDFAAGLAVLQRGRWIYVQLSKWNGLRSWTLQEKYGNGLVFFADYQKQKNQHEMVWAHECCRKIWKLTFCGLSRKLTRHT